MRFPDFKNELEYLNRGYTYVAGCDEVGRGPIAGPVVAAACVLDHKSIGKSRTKNKWYARVRDSKTTTPKEREILVKEILSHSIAHGLGVVWQEEIDEINIHHASLKAMRLAVGDLMTKLSNPSKLILLIDGRFKIPDLNVDQESIVDGDALVLSISAASIIAKVHRDNIMEKFDHQFPNYGFAKHKGYQTPAHTLALKRWGKSLIHRKSFIK